MAAMNSCTFVGRGQLTVRHTQVLDKLPSPDHSQAAADTQLVCMEVLQCTEHGQYTQWKFSKYEKDYQFLWLLVKTTVNGILYTVIDLGLVQ